MGTLGPQATPAGSRAPGSRPRQVDLRAPLIAHGFSEAERRSGRQLFERGAVRDRRWANFVVSGWVVEGGREYHAALEFASPESKTRTVVPTCTCSVDQYGAMCRHIYAALLDHDADQLGTPVVTVPDPHSFDEVAAHRLWQVDTDQEAPTRRRVGHDDVAQQIAATVDDMAREWRATRVQVRRLAAEDFADELADEFLDDHLLGVDSDDEDWEEDLWDDDLLEDDDPDLADFAPRRANRRAAARARRSSGDSPGPKAVPGPRLLESAAQPQRDPERRLRALELRTGAVPSHLRPTRLTYLIEPSEDALTLRLQRQRRTRTGKWGALARLHRHDLPHSRLTAEDDAVLARLLGAASPAPQTWRLFGGVGRSPEPDPADPLRLAPQSVDLLLPMLVATGRCHLRAAARALIGEPSPPLSACGRVRFTVRGETTGERFALVGELRRGDEVVASVSQEGGPRPVLLGPSHVAVGAKLFEFEARADRDLARTLLLHGPLEAPVGKRDVFLRRFVQLPGARHLEDDTLTEPTVQPLRPQLTIEDPAAHARQTLEAQIAFDYGDGDVARPIDRRTHFFRAGRLRPRDIDAETRHLELLEQLDVVLQPPSPDGEQSVKLPRARLDEVVVALTKAGCDVFAAGMPVRRGSSPALRISSGKDWFEVSGAIDFDGVTVELPELLRLRDRTGPQNLVRLGDGSLGVLASEWLDRWQGLLGLGKVQGDAVRLLPTQAWLLDAMLREHQGTIDVDAAFANARRALRSHASVAPEPTPAGFRTELRGYQCEGLGWLLFLNRLGLGGCLADDMGLGKTVQVLALLALLRAGSERDGDGPVREAGEAREAERGPALIVAPLSLLDNWQREAARFCPELSATLFFGPQRSVTHGDDLASGFADRDLVLTTYGTLRRDIDKLREIRFRYVILDEAQAIKNDQAQVSKAVRLLHADHRLALTGTPIENHLGEIWSLLEFLNPGMLGRSRVFKKLARASVTAGAPGADEFVADLARALGPFLLRRTKEQVLPDLPEKSEQVLHVELPRVQRRQYDELRDYYRDTVLGKIRADELEGGGLGGNQMSVLDALLRLRQAACHPGLIAPAHADAECGKFEALLPMLEELMEGRHKALVFSQFTSLLALLKPQLDARGIVYEYLDGKTRNRQARVDRFQQDPACQVFLISLKAGGVGLNLTAADYVFLLDPWWNPAVENQAIDRTHRIGQTQRVFAYRLIAKDTVEEHVAALQEEKRALVDAVLAGGGGGLAGLTVRDIERLLE